MYQALVARLYLSVPVPEARAARRRRRTAVVFVTGGHFAGASGIARAQRHYSRLAAGSRLVSALDPLPIVVHALNEFRPAMLARYPSALDVLAAERREGRLRLAPALLLARRRATVGGGESADRGSLRRPGAGHLQRLGVPRDAYDGGHGLLHVHADWIVLEPVTADHAPVPAGQLSDTVLLTNLANRVQPLIRYDLGDRVLISPDPCPCGSPLPAMRVEGRTNDVLVIGSGQGRSGSCRCPW